MPLLAVLWAAPAAATDNYVYRAGEYVTISGGRSPDGRWSIAAHGDGELGYDNFHLYLLREPSHKKLVMLRTGDHLDTGPLSIVGLWSPDASRVAILYRSDRHIMDLRLFDVTDGKLHRVNVPSLVKVVGQRYFKPGTRRELFGRQYRVVWQKPDHLILEESETFDAAQPAFRPGLEPYLTVNQTNPNRVFTGFVATARYKVTKTGKLRLLEVRPVSNESQTFIYSPHLRVDPEHGLYDTETSLSSLAAQKGRE